MQIQMIWFVVKKVLLEASFCSLWKQMQRPTAKHYTELRESCRRVRERVEETGKGRHTVRRPIDTTNLGP